MQSFFAFLKNKYFKFGLTAVFYLLWVIWVGNYFLLLGLGIIFDQYITKKVNWTFWKKRNVKKGERSATAEWVDALIFAAIAATFIRMFFIEAYTIPTSSMEKSLLVGDFLFVSKVAYGPKMPNTPIAFPFVHHTMPFATETRSFVEWIQWPYKRLAGLGEVKRNDVVVFNFPAGDTVLLDNPTADYYQECRYIGREAIWDRFGTRIIHRPMDKCENYIKRCVAVSGDSLQVKQGQVFINGKPQEGIPGIQFLYTVKTQGSKINDIRLDELEIPQESRGFDPSRSEHTMFLSAETAQELRKLPIVISVERYKEQGNSIVFPFSKNYPWTKDNYGPLWIPKKGVTIDLNLKNLPIYERIIGHYEANKLEVKDSSIFINGTLATSYTFKMDYFFMMGDNRDNSADSRFWGFVPEDHVVGKGSFIWLSLNKDKSFPSNIRWSRMFSVIR
ncbi:signal peptidase I [Williamwhitmania taraxaci]|uniref:Signal peptidase I n=1 Tax=Williamwhitmania taraxaci TaxID=1640674 RepID=A0A1G6P945_9BACT|nr:signal peptidase I [Williamwhitmania taraxaci]SDC75885.1 signal peptidase I [Williamwhitmania taraxaci]